jgi:dihydrofolate synthase / folylpolyglutamate synthase
MVQPSADEYAAALGFLYGRINYEQATIPYRSRELNLERMQELLDRLDNPHTLRPIVHIAGTKGKGSTAAMISAILIAAGYRVGLYTSPHLIRLEERFEVNGEPCSAASLIELARTVQNVVAEMDRGSEVGHRSTFFDITTAMAFLYFARRDVDISVVEVGMGGRLDSTNVCHPVVSVITSISFDHTKQLGNTLAAIAGEKAGIIKPNVPVISGVVAPEPAEVIAEIANRRSSELFRREHEFFCDYRRGLDGGPGTVSYWENPNNSESRLNDLKLGMRGQHQAANASVALATIHRLRDLNWVISNEACREGLASAHCPARIEVVSQHPAVVLDTAHNLASVNALLETLAESFPKGKRLLIFAVARDKDADGMLRQLLPEFDHVILTQFKSNPRALPLSTLTEQAAAIVRELSLHRVTLHSEEEPSLAWQRCKSLTTSDSNICITGSFFLAAELRSLIRTGQCCEIGSSESITSSC